MRSHEVVTTSAWVLVRLPAYVVAVMVGVMTPLATGIVGVPERLRRAVWIAGALAGIGLVLVTEAGLLAVATVVPYAVVAGLVGLVGARRWLAWPRTASEAASATALAFVPAAAAWLVAARAGYALLGYTPFWVLLTAAHFHVAGVCLLAVIGRAAAGRGPAAALVALGCVIAVPLTAAGIYGPRWLEVGAACMMAASGFGAGLVLVTAPRSLAGERTTVLRGAGALLLATMVLAALFALRDHGITIAVFGLDPLASMLIAHGVPNTILVMLTAVIALPRASVRNNGRRAD